MNLVQFDHIETEESGLHSFPIDKGKIMDGLQGKVDMEYLQAQANESFWEYERGNITLGELCEELFELGLHIEGVAWSQEHPKPKAIKGEPSGCRAVREAHIRGLGVVCRLIGTDGPKITLRPC